MTSDSVKRTYRNEWKCQMFWSLELKDVGGFNMNIAHYNDDLIDLLKRMRICAENAPDDPEMAHAQAEGILIQTINILAERLNESEITDKIINAFNDVYRWYA